MYTLAGEGQNSDLEVTFEVANLSVHIEQNKTTKTRSKQTGRWHVGNPSSIVQQKIGGMLKLPAKATLAYIKK